MKQRSYIPFMIAAGLLFLTGLVLGAGMSSDETSAANTASKMLLTVGLIAFLATSALEVVRRRRAVRKTV